MSLEMDTGGNVSNAGAPAITVGPGNLATANAALVNVQGEQLVVDKTVAELLIRLILEVRMLRVVISDADAGNDIGGVFTI